MHTRADIVTVRLLRLSVIALVIAVPMTADVLDRLGDAHRILASVTLWSLWAIMLLSILVPASSALTALRLAAPAHLATLIMVTATAGIDLGSAVALASSAIVALLSSSGEVGAHFIQSSAYGDERRFPLRCPRPALVVVILAWSLWFATAAVGAIVLVAGMLIGAIFVAIALAGFVFLPRRFHRYSRRWLVQVPAGLVVHDHVLLTETAMLPRRAIIGIDAWSPSTAKDSPNSSNDEPFDLSGGLTSSGVVIRLSDPETVILAPTKDHPGGRAFHVQSARVCPTRIGRALTLLTKQS